MADRKKISQVLIESQKTRKQLFKKLWNADVKKISDIKGYCAMGALMCESGLIEESDGDNHYLIAPSDKQLFEYFIGSKKYNTLSQCKICIDQTHPVNDEGVFTKENPFNSAYLSSHIIHLNDIHHMTFEEIGKELERMGF